MPAVGALGCGRDAGQNLRTQGPAGFFRAALRLLRVYSEKADNLPVTAPIVGRLVIRKYALTRRRRWQAESARNLASLRWGLLPGRRTAGAARPHRSRAYLETLRPLLATSGRSAMLATSPSPEPAC